MSKLDNAIIENIENISLNAGYMAADNKIVINDFNEFSIVVEKLAKEFEAQYNKEEDYYNSIDDFSENKLLQLYGIDRGAENAKKSM